MSGFTNDRLRDWFWFIEEQYPPFARMRQEHSDTIKKRIKGFDVLAPTEKKLGLLIPIIGKPWAIKNAARVKKGALAGFNQRFIIFDFEKNKHYPFNYNRIVQLERKYSDLYLHLDSDHQLVFKFNLPIKRKLGWSAFNILMGMSGAGTSRNDPAHRYAVTEATRDNADQANADADLMVEYINTIYAYFLEAVEGQRSPANEV